VQARTAAVLEAVPGVEIIRHRGGIRIGRACTGVLVTRVLVTQIRHHGQVPGAALAAG